MGGAPTSGPGGRRAANAAAGIALYLRASVPDRLRRWLKLARQLFGERPAFTNWIISRRNSGAYHRLHRALLERECWSVQETASTPV
jgi:hypothetical protein